MEGSFVRGPASFIFQDSSTVPPVTVKMPKRSGGFPLVGAAKAETRCSESMNGSAKSAPAPRRKWRRERVESFIWIRRGERFAGPRNTLKRQKGGRNFANEV